MEIMDIALNVKRLRQKSGMTLDQLAARVKVTKGYLSQLENFRTMPSIPILYKIAEALDVKPGLLLERNSQPKAFVVKRKGEGPIVEREFPESGFIYKAMAREKAGRLMDPFLLELPPQSKREDVKTDGEEFCLMLEGECDFILGKQKVKLRTGDSLYFDGEVPHHPENNGMKKAVMLVIYCIKRV